MSTKHKCLFQIVEISLKCQARRLVEGEYKMDDISNVVILYFLLTGKMRLDNDKSLPTGSLQNTQISLLTEKSL